MGSVFFFLVSCITAMSSNELLVKFEKDRSPTHFIETYGGTLKLVSSDGNVYLWKSEIGAKAFEFLDAPFVEKVQPNYPIRLMSNPSLEKNREILREFVGHAQNEREPAYPDNPEIKNSEQISQGKDPLLSNSWGLFQIGAPNAWAKTAQGKDIIVAISDTGVDYNHDDLIQNMWRNPGETPNDGIDNDQNGYVDDIVGWDFYSNDSHPYDLSMSIGDILFKGGNPGHGTHVAGVVAAQLNNKKGTAGVAPRASIMAVRFISEEGKGDTAGAIGTIDYAVKNGAKVINASWGSEGEEEGDELLRESIQRAEEAGVIFVAAAGNGRSANATMEPKGYDNDTDPKPMFPATYPYSNIVSVAAMSPSESLASFSNFGKKSVDIGAPGVKILSTVPGNKFQDTIIDIGEIKVTWDGTSMASPFVAGALAVIWSQNQAMSNQEVIGQLLKEAKAITALKDKVVTDGRLDLSYL